jgi:hypothetical protein
LNEKVGEYSVKKLLSVFFFSLCISLFLSTSGIMAQQSDFYPIHIGEHFPEVAMKTPANENDRFYLGLRRTPTFTMNDIQADLVLVEILNTYCFSCQEQAPKLNKLFLSIQEDRSLRGRIKLIGIAIGNDETEVRDFREKFAVPFPVITDTDFELHMAIGEVTAPFTIAVRVDNKENTMIVARTHMGKFDDSSVFLEDMRLLMTMNFHDITQEGHQTETMIISVRPLLIEYELIARIKLAMAGCSGIISEFEKIKTGGGPVYTGLVHDSGEPIRHFAVMTSRPSVCDICHNLHFFYVFNQEGKIVDFVPLHLTKWKNKLWNEKDVQFMRDRVLGRYIFEPFIFDSSVDAVTSATITSVIIFQSLSRGRIIFEELEKLGLVVKADL